MYTSSRDRILDAAERVLIRDSDGSLTVDAVIREAGVSKGGFFHHFATKDDLLVAVTDRLAAWVAEQERGAPDGPLQARIRLAFDLEGDTKARLHALILVLIGAARKHAGVVSEVAEDFDRGKRAENVPIGAALAVQLALDGLWLGEALGTVRLDDGERRALRATLVALVEGR